MNQVEKYLKENVSNYLDELKEYLSIPSISTIVGKKEDIRRCADFVAGKLRDAGMKRVEIFQTEGHPLVYGEWLEKPGKPTVLIYGHYDVQPVDPLNEWKTPPFEAVIKEGKIFARGANDNKGQNFIHIKSVEAFLKTIGTLPLNVKFIIEGEEEVGSGSLISFISQNKELLKCDSVLISDTALFGPGIPTISYGLRGICFFEIELQNSNQDLHSGAFGGAVLNPINALAKIIAKLHDNNGKITIPNFYKDVVKINYKEKKGIRRLRFSNKKFAEATGIKSLFGEKGYSTLERIWIRPSLDCNGIIGGFTEQGTKTIIPAKASSKISIRLVPNQNPDRIAKDFIKFVKSNCPKSMKLAVKYLAGIGAVVVPTEEKAVKSADIALSKAFGQKSLYKREGGTIPIVLEFYKILKVPVVLMGFGLDSDNIHSPNEHFHLENFELGLLSSAYFLEDFAK